MPNEFRDCDDPGTWPHVQGRAWYVLRTKQRKEVATEKRLQSHGLETYLPLLLQWPRPAVGSDVVPMFPCYLFVCADTPHDFHRARVTPGVQGFVTVGREPAQVDETAISFLRSRESSDGIIRLDRVPAGRYVKIVEGPFKGLVAVVERLVPARERVRVLLDMLQRQTSVEVPEGWIRRIAQLEKPNRGGNSALRGRTEVKRAQSTQRYRRLDPSRGSAG